LQFGAGAGQATGGCALLVHCVASRRHTPSHATRKHNATHANTQERDREKARVDAERLASERSFYSELQRQEADAKSGGQGGMNPHKKKRRHTG
jgi:hypothetical protein